MSEWGVASFRASRTQHDDRWGAIQPSTFLGWGVTLTPTELRVELFVVLRRYRAGWRRVTLQGENNEKETVTVFMDVNKPGLWGSGVFMVREATHE